MFNETKLYSELEMAELSFDESMEFFRLTSPQESIFYDQLLYPSNPCYNISALLELHTAVDESVLREALDRLTLTHDALRMKAVKLSEGVFQYFRNGTDTYHYHTVDLSDDVNAEQSLEETVRQHMQTPIDMFGDKLWEFVDIRLAGGRVACLLKFHHLCVDGISVSLIVRNLFRECENIISGHDRESQYLDSQKVAYAEYIKESERYLNSERLNKDKVSWMQKVGELDDLIFNDGNAPGEFKASSSVKNAIARAEYNRLLSYAAKHGCSSTHLFLALIANYFSRIKNKSKLIVGLSIHNRSKGNKEAIGCFASVIPVPIVIPKSGSFTELMQEVARTLRSCYRCQKYPMTLLSRDLELGARGQTRIFDISLSMENFLADETFALSEYTLDRRDPSYEQVPLAIAVRDYSSTTAVALNFEYNRAFTNEEHVGEIGYYFEKLLDQIKNGDESELDILSLLTEEELQQQISFGRGKEKNYSGATNMVTRFEALASVRPKACAAVDSRGRISYAELNERANQLAHYLREQGVGPNQLVGIYAQRSIDFVVGILGTMKAGGAYVPLDPTNPTERLEYMLENAQASVIVSQKAQLKKWPSLSDKNVVCVDDSELLASYSSANSPVDLHGDSYAYMIYTSGTTGQPKGAVVHHAGALNHIDAEFDLLGFMDDNGELLPRHFLQSAASSSDVSVWQFLAPLMSGGKTVILEEPTDIRQWVSLIQKEGVHLIQTAPVVLQLFFNYLNNASEQERRLPSLKWLMTIAEATPVPLVNAWLTLYPDIPVMNGYGPTEASDDITYHIMREPFEAKSVPIGKALHNLSMYVLDDHLQLLPLGVVGEVCVSGVGVGPGYWQNPEKTEAAFADNPFQAIGGHGTRLYRTGDLGRWLPDGTLELIGRKDSQVKVRGFRVELGEIEAAMSRLSQISDVAVIVHKNAQGENQLTSYIVGANEASDESLSVEVLRKDILTMLPAHMVPSSFTVLEHMPLNAADKIDRKALPRPDGQTQKTYEAPQGDVENLLATLWQELLGVERVSRDDNFFDLGGHSLLIMQLIEQLRTYNLELVARSVFDTPNLKSLAEVLNPLSSSNQEPTPPCLIPEQCDRITPDMLSLVELSQEEIDAVAAGVPGGMKNIQDIYPLAPLQKGILFHHMMAEAGDTYITPILLKFDSAELADNFITSFKKVVTRHDILRTSIVWEGVNEAVQVVHRNAELPVKVITLNDDRPFDVQLNELTSFENMSMDLNEAPLLRCELILGGDEQCYLLLKEHHLISDHVSLDIEINEIYSFLNGKESELENPVQYREYIAHVGRSNVEEKTEIFFSQYLDGIEETTAPYGLENIYEDGSNTEKCVLDLDKKLATELRQFSTQHKVSVANMVHLAWALLVGKCSAKNDVVFGTIMSGRLQGTLGADKMMGLFINMLPVRVNLENTTVAEALNAIRSNLSELIEYEYCSLADIQKAAGFTSSKPLFSSMLNYRHVDLAGDVGQWAGMEVVSADELTNYPFEVSFTEKKDGFEIEANIDRSVGAARVVSYLRQTLVSLLDALEKAPEAQLLSLSVIPEKEIEEQAVFSHGETRDYSGATNMVTRFEALASVRPKACAAVDSRGRISYAELNERANQLAHYLREQGVGPNQLVGIYAQRSIDFVVGILGTMKAGGAYVPLDPTNPIERLEYMLENAEASVIVSQKAQLKKWPSLSDKNVACVDDSELLASYSSANSPVDLHGDNYAYMIYTSGSTGQPKGAVVHHAGALNHIDAEFDLLGFMDDNGELLPRHFLQSAASSSDVSVWQFLAPLMSGGKTVILDEPTDIRQWVSLIQKEGVHLIQTAPVVLQLFFNYLNNASEQERRLPSLKWLMTIAEATPVPLVNAWLTLYPDIPVMNGYGPTEASDDITYHIMHEPFEAKSVPIGKALHNLSMYVLDDHLQLLPLGVVGEVCVSGVGVGPGYWQNPEKTEAAFADNPFQAIGGHGTRLYRTGDLGRWLPDGTLELIGRKDSQVKVRGFRVELGEIEAAMSRLSQISDVAVIVHKNAQGENQLASYIVGANEASDESLSVEVLRKDILTMLPAHMVPSSFTILEHMPLNAADKIDRKALPRPDGQTQKTYEAPQGDVENLLATLWQELLGVERVSRDDNFFDLGGHSLLIMQLIEQLRRRDLEISAKDVFDYANLQAMAGRLNKKGTEAAFSTPENLIPLGCKRITADMLTLVDLSQDDVDTIVSSVPGGAANVQDIYPLAPLQQGILFHHLMAEDGDTYITPIILKMNNRQRVEDFIHALQKVTDRHDILRTALAWEGLTTPVQIVYREADIPISEITLNSDAPVLEQLEQIVSVEQRNLDLNKGPLMRIELARDPAPKSECWYLILKEHHLISDHVSLECEIEEIQQVLAGKEEELVAPVQYREFVAHTMARAKTYDTQEYFGARLGDIDSPTAPFGLLDVYGDGSKTDRLVVDVNDTISARIHQQAKSISASPASLFHLAWSLVVAKCSGKNRVVFGTVMSGRLQGVVGSDHMLGMFINMLPLRVDLAGYSVADSLKQVQRNLIELVNYEQSSLADVQKCSAIKGKLPLFSAIMNYRHEGEAVEGVLGANAPGDPRESSSAWNGIEIVHTTVEEYTNYPFEMSVDVKGAGFSLEAFVDRQVGVERIVRYTLETLEQLLIALESEPSRSILNVNVVPQCDQLSHGELFAFGQDTEQTRITELTNEKRDFESPDGDAEEALAAQWRKLLNRDGVSRWDNFFDLGGHSLLIMQLIEGLRQRGLELQARHVFDTPNLKALAETLTERDDSGWQGAPPNLIPMDSDVITADMLPLVKLTQSELDRIVSAVPGGASNVQDIYPLAPLQKGILFHHLMVEEGDTYITPIILKMDSRERIDDFICALQAVVDRHDILRSALAWEGLSNPVQVVYREAVIPVSEFVLNSIDPVVEQLDKLVSVDQRKLDLNQGPLMRIELARDPVENSDAWYLILKEHHLISDHVSLELEIEEIQQVLAGKESELAEPIQYREFVAHTLEQTKTHNTQHYFTHQLGDIEAPTAPFGLLDVYGDGSQTERLVTDIDENLSRRIHDQAKSINASPASVFHLAWGLVVAACSGREDVVFGTVMSGRLQGAFGSDQMLGLFINMLPLRIRLEGQSIGRCLQQVQKNLIELVSYEQAALSEIQKCSAISGTLPLFSAIMNYRHEGEAVENVQSAQSSWEGMEVIETTIEEYTNYPFEMSVDVKDNGFSLEAFVDRQVGVDRIARYMSHALEQIVSGLENDRSMAVQLINVIPKADALGHRELFVAGQVRQQSFMVNLENEARDFESPQGESEEALAEQWCELLHRDSVSRWDNFFDLGGHSLLIMQLIEGLRQRGYELQARHVFGSPNLKALAETLTERDDSGWQGAPPNLIPMDCDAITADMLPLIKLTQSELDSIISTVPGGASNVQDIYPLAPLQQGILFHHLMAVKGDTYITPIILKMDNRQRVDDFIHALQTVADRHDILRTALAWEGLSTPVQVVYREANIPVNEFNLNVDEDVVDQLERLVGVELRNLDLNQGPLMRIELARDPMANSEAWFLILKEHHLISDHVSLELEIEEIQKVLAGKEQELTAPIQYREFVAHTIEQAKTHNAHNYFSKRLQDITQPTAPFGLLDVYGDGSKTERLVTNVDDALSARIHQQAKAINASPASLFHLAWGLVVAACSGKEDVVFGTVMSGRLQGAVGSDQMLGLFINMLPLRLSIAGIPLKECLLNMQRDLVELVNYEQAPLSEVQRCSSISGNLPLFSAIMNYRHEEEIQEDALVENWHGIHGVETRIDEYTNYPFEMSVDVKGKGFALEAFVDQQVGVERIVGYMIEALEKTVEALETHSSLAANLIQVVPEQGKAQHEKLFLAGQERESILTNNVQNAVREFESPYGDLEEAVAEQWCRLLNREAISRWDNFFDLGGHSLLIMQLIEGLRRSGLELQARHVFDTPNLATLAKTLSELDESGWQGAPPNLIPMDCDEITVDMLPLVRLTQQEVDSVVVTVPGGAANIQDIYPLAPLQQGILFHHFMVDEGDTYITPIILKMDNRQRADDFINALQKVTNRHDILRTAFVWEGLSNPVQVVYREAEIPVSEFDLHCDEPVAEQLERLVDVDQRNLNLTRGPLMRIELARDPEEGSEAWYLILKEHHLISDHVSLELEIEEIQQVLAGKERDLLEPIQYREFVAHTIEQAKVHDANSYFTEKLGDIEEPTTPFGLLDVYGSGSRTERLVSAIDNGLSRRIHQQAKAINASPASLFHLAWGLVIAKCSGREDVVFGTVMSGRLQGVVGSDQMLGLFINMLPMRLSLSDASVKMSLKNTQRELVDLVNYEQAPLAEVQRCSAIQGNLPLFSAVMNYRHEDDSQEENWLDNWQGIHGVETQVDEYTNYPFTLSVDVVGQGFSLELLADSQVGVQRVNDYVVSALESIVTALETDSEARSYNSEEAKILSLNILPEYEKAQLINISQPEVQVKTHSDVGISCEIDEHLCHKLFERNAEKYSDRPALVFGETSLTYGQLNRKSNQLAHQLVECGVGPETLVGICLDRSIDMVVSLLAVLKSGGAYVPLDCNAPAERLQYIINDSQPSVLITSSEFDALFDNVNTQVLCLDVLRTKDNSIDNPKIHSLNTSSPAYVIYTSGSTGNPKGVVVEHINLARLFSSTESDFNFDEHDVWTLFHSFAFDFSVWEIWGALAYGGKLVVVPSSVARSTEEFYQLLADEKVTVLNHTPSAFYPLIDVDSRNQKLLNLRFVIFGGEALTPNLLRPWFERHGDSSPALVNMYGITETTVHVTYKRLLLSDLNNVKSNIGRPIDDLGIMILSPQLTLVPKGVIGEMYISGMGLARGYLNRDELTLERFIENPYVRGGRLYKTGDLARLDDNGELEYVGRCDDQVKIRGFRIELGEVETQLAGCAYVKSCTVIALTDHAGSKYLAAYVVPDSMRCSIRTGEKTENYRYIEEIKVELQTCLPTYMVPSAFVVLDALPLTINGKVDKKKLPDPDNSAQKHSEFVAPNSRREQALAEAWQILLQIDKVSRLDNFFDLGGHSLLVVQLLEQMRQRGYTLSAKDVFASANLAKLSKCVSLAEGVRRSAPKNKIPTGCQKITPDMLPLIDLSQEVIDEIAKKVPGGTENIQDIYPLAPLQEGLLFHNMMNRDGDLYVTPVLLNFNSDQEVEHFYSALESVIQRHDILRTSFLSKGFDKAVQVVLRDVELTKLELSLDGGKSIKSQLDAHMGFESLKIDLESAPLITLEHARDPHSDVRYVILKQHHLVTDNVSIAIEIEEIYAMMRGETLADPTQYRELVAHVLETQNSTEVKDYFTPRLSDIESPCTPFGVTDIHSDGQGSDFKLVHLPSELSVAVHQLSETFCVRPAALFHMAWALVIAKTSNTNDVVFGTVMSGRMQGIEGGDRALGMFVNTLPLCLSLNNLSLQEALKSTHDELMGLIQFEHTSLSEIQALSSVKPLFSALINYTQNVDDSSSEGEIIDQSSVESDFHSEYSSYPVDLDIEADGNEFILRFCVERSIGVDRIANYTLSAMDSIVNSLFSSPDSELLNLDILPQEESEFLISQFGSSEFESQYIENVLAQDSIPVQPSEMNCVHNVFENHVALTPNQIAVVHDDKAITYKELDESSNAVANVLMQRGISCGDLVGLYVERSLDMIVGIFGILKAGAAYVPLDPKYPDERIQYMLEDSGISFVLCQSHLRNRSPLTRSDREKTLTIITFDNVKRSDQSKLSNVITELNLAYVIYTSGSTGQPKGVMVEHRNLVNLTQSLGIDYGLSSGERMLQFAAMSFDMSVEEIFGALCNGATLVLRTDSCIEGPRQFWEFCTQNQVSVANLPTAFWHVLVEDESKVPGCLKHISIGGEAVNQQKLDAWFRRPEKLPFLVNAYGPTEATVNAAIKSVETSSNSIGRPTLNTQLYIVDEQGKLVPQGVEGELWIGGAGVARGYLNKPELTRSKFIDDPFCLTFQNEGSKARVYKTGDLCRWQDDGSLEYLGRADHQVKIRGFRIELGEIESRLNRHPVVRDAVVIVRDLNGDKKLVAYVVLNSDTDQTQGGIHDVREFLKMDLPEYMLPSAYCSLDSLPLTPAGKVDRKHLPEPDSSAFVNRDYVQPEGEIEILLASIWQNVLGVDTVGRDDNFFELGGHSLLVIGVVEQLRKHGYDLPARNIFEAPKLNQLAEITQRDLGNAGCTGSRLVPENKIPFDCKNINPDMLPLADLTETDIAKIVSRVSGGVSNIQDIYGLAPLQQGLLFHHQVNEQGDTYLLHTVLKLDSKKRVERFCEALQAVIERHDILRTAIFWEGISQAVQVVHRNVTLPVTEFSLNPGKELQIQLDERVSLSSRHMKLDSAPLVAVEIAQSIEDDSWYLVLKQHHIIGDEVAFALQLEEIQGLMQGEILGEETGSQRESSLPVPVQYREFIAGINPQRLNNTEGDSETEVELSSRKYFSKKLGDFTEPSLPFGLVDVYGDGSDSDRTATTLSNALSKKIHVQSRKQRVSAASLFHLACGLVVGRYSNREDVVFGSVMSGRMQGASSMARMLGMAINTLPLRINFEGLTVANALKDTAETIHELIVHEQAELASAQQCAGVDVGQPLFNTLFNYRNGSNDEGGDNDWEGIVELEVDDRGNTNYPIEVSVDASDNEFSISVQVCGGVSANRLVIAFEKTLDELVDALDAGGNTLISDLALLPKDEWNEEILAAQSASSCGYTDRSVVSIFEDRVRRSPQATALIYSDSAGKRSVLSYRDLNIKANKLARYLKTAGVEKGCCVGVVMQRSKQQVVSQLAILKLSATYVPIDPSYPMERQEYILTNSSVVCTLTDSGESTIEHSSLDSMYGNIAVHIDCRILSEKIDVLSGRKIPGLQYDNSVPAYVMYTSGSTGMPKGVMTPHAGITRVCVNNGFAEFGRRDCFVHASNPAFDASTIEVWGALLNGAKLLLVTPEQVLDPHKYAEVLIENNATVMWMSVGIFNQYASILGDVFTRLNYLMVGGDALNPASIKHVLDNYPPKNLLNGYGPTETTTFASTHLIKHVVEGESIPIGSPISNTQMYILDRYLRPVPKGTMGEIYIGGDGLAQGYMNRGDLTEERFVFSPFIDGVRLYKSGDLGRRLNDGVIEFSGRCDNQVKLRGFRIELDEITAKITELDDIADALVVVSGGDIDENEGEIESRKRLVAYVSPAGLDDDASIAMPNVLEFSQCISEKVSQSLPEFMVPELFVVLEKMPLNMNGKIDRKALPTPDFSQLQIAEYEPPQTETEIKLARIWEEVLHVEAVGRQDCFADLGGHSLVLMTMLVRIKETFALEVPIQSAFELSHLFDFAEFIDSKIENSDRIELHLDEPSQTDFDFKDETVESNPSEEMDYEVFDI